MSIQDSTPLSDLTVGEFKMLIQKVVEDIVQTAIMDLEQQLPDPDEGLELKPEIQARLRHSLEQNGELISVEDVKRELGIDG